MSIFIIRKQCNTGTNTGDLSVHSSIGPYGQWLVDNNSLDGDDALALPLGLLVHLDVRAGGGPYRVDVGAGAADHARYRV